MEVVKISQPKIDWNKMLTHSEISKCDQCHDLCLPTNQPTNHQRAAGVMHFCRLTRVLAQPWIL